MWHLVRGSLFSSHVNLSSAPGRKARGPPGNKCLHDTMGGFSYYSLLGRLFLCLIFPLSETCSPLKFQSSLWEMLRCLKRETIQETQIIPISCLPRSPIISFFYSICLASFFNNSTYLHHKVAMGIELVNINRLEHTVAAAAAKSLQSCPTLCDPIDGSPPGSPVPGILQARTLEWVAISFSSAWKWKVKVKLLSPVRLLATPWTAAFQAPPSLGFSTQDYWSGVPLPSLRTHKCSQILGSLVAQW